MKFGPLLSSNLASVRDQSRREVARTAAGITGILNWTGFDIN